MTLKCESDLNRVCNSIKISTSFTYFSRHDSTCFCNESSFVKFKDLPGTDSFLMTPKHPKQNQQNHGQSQFRIKTVSKSVQATSKCKNMSQHLVRSNSATELLESDSGKYRHLAKRQLVVALGQLRTELHQRDLGCVGRDFHFAVLIIVIWFTYSSFNFLLTSNESLIPIRVHVGHDVGIELFEKPSQVLVHVTPDQQRFQANGDVKVPLAVSQRNYGALSSKPTALLIRQDLHLRIKM